MWCGSTALRHLASKDRLGPETRAFQLHAFVEMAHDHHFTFGNLACVIGPQTQRKGRFLMRFDHRAEIADAPGDGIGQVSADTHPAR